MAVELIQEVKPKLFLQNTPVSYLVLSDFSVTEQLSACPNPPSALPTCNLSNLWAQEPVLRACCLSGLSLWSIEGKLCVEGLPQFQ